MRIPISYCMDESKAAQLNSGEFSDILTFRSAQGRAISDWDRYQSQAVSRVEFSSHLFFTMKQGLIPLLSNEMSGRQEAISGGGPVPGLSDRPGGGEFPSPQWQTPGEW